MFSNIYLLYKDTNLELVSKVIPHKCLVVQSPSGQVLCLTGYGQSKQVILVGTAGGQVALWAIQNPTAPVKIFAMPDNPGRVLSLEFDGTDAILAGTSHGTVVQWSMK